MSIAEDIAQHFQHLLDNDGIPHKGVTVLTPVGALFIYLPEYKVKMAYITAHILGYKAASHTLYHRWRRENERN